MREAERRGEGRVRLGVVIFLLVVVALLYVANKLIPPYWAYLSLMDPVKEAAMLAASNQGGEASARAQLVAAARAQGVDIAEDDIEFIQEAAGLTLRVSWVTPVEFPRYRYDIHFSIEQTALHP